MRSLIPVSALLLSTFTPSQTRQFQAEAHRGPTLFLTGSSLSVACGDVDGDGDLDCLVSRADTWFRRTDVLLYRRQAGTWQQSARASVQGVSNYIPRIEVKVADLDGDADLDVVAVVTGESAGAITRILCFRNDGGGSFPLASTIQLPGIAGAQLAVGDVDGDADLDLILARQDAAGQPLALALYLHDGTFGFQEVTGALPSTPASAPDLADLDGDSDLDLVAVGTAGSVLAFTNQAGNFAGGAVATGPTRHVVAADLDGDGDGDLLAQAPDGSVVLLRNTPTGFQRQVVATGGSSAGLRPILADFDADQDLDVAFQVDSELRVLRNDGLAGFTVETIAGSGQFAAGDADQDGRMDLLFDVNGYGLALALGRTGRMLVDPAVLHRPYVALANSGMTEDAADLDRDGRIDVVQQDNYRLLVRRNRGAGEWSTVDLPVPFLRPRARAADVDGDGDDDLVVVNSDSAGGLLVFRLDAGFRFTPVPQQSLAAATFAGKGDFDRDGRDDLLILTGSGPVLQLLRSTGGTFAPPVTLFTGSVGWFAPGIWDWDGDQDLDLLVVAAYGSCAQLLVNDGNGNFALANPCAVQAQPSWPNLSNMKLVDIDGDADADLFTWSYGSGLLLVNNGGSFTLAQVINGVFGSALLKPTFADWDGDGDMDMLQLGGPAQLWLNSGNGTMVDETAARIGYMEFTGAGAADLDGDGDPDVLGVFGMLSTHIMNHLRSATTLSAPSLGGQLRVRFAHEPGISAGIKLCMPIVALQDRSAPLHIAGIAGTWQLDINSSVVLPPLSLPAPAGTAETVVAVPMQPALIGLDLFAQGLILGASPAFTPVVHERILP